MNETLELYLFVHRQTKYQGREPKLRFRLKRPTHSVFQPYLVQLK